MTVLDTGGLYAADLLSTDQSHFRALRGPRGTPFRLLPYDD